MHRVVDAKVAFKTPDKGTGVFGMERLVHGRYTIPLKHVLSSMQERWQLKGCLGGARARYKKPSTASNTAWTTLFTPQVAMSQSRTQVPPCASTMHDPLVP